MTMRDTEIEDIYARAKSLDALGSDPTALAAVNWDRTETRVTPAGAVERVGYDAMTGHSAVLGVEPAQQPVQMAEARIEQRIENGTAFDVEVRGDGSEWLLGRSGEARGAGMMLRAPATPKNAEQGPQPSAGGGEADEPSIVADIGRGVFHGANQFVEEFLKTTRLDGVASWLDEATGTEPVQYDLPKTTAGEVAAGMSQSVAAMVPAARATKALGAVSNFLRWTTAGALTDAVGFSPDTPGIGDMVKGLGELDQPTLEAVRSTIADALAKDEDDGELEKRLKNVGGGVLAGATVDGLMGLYRGSRGLSGATGKAFDTFAQAVDAAAARVEASKAAGETMVRGGGPSTEEMLAGLKPSVDALRGMSAGSVPATVADAPLPKGSADVLAEPWRAYTQGAPEKVDFNLDRLDTTDDVKRQINNISRAYVEQIDTIKKGSIPLDVTRQAADLIGVDPASVEKVAKSLPMDTEDLHVRVTVMRDMMVQSAQRLDELARAVTADPTRVTDADLLAFREQMVRHAALQANMKGVQTEIARALSAFRIPADGGPLSRAHAMNDLINAMGGRSTAEELARRWLDTPVEKRGAFVEKGVLAKTKDAVFEIWINGLLASTRTHEVNLASNVLFTAWQIPERAIAASIGQARRVLPGGASDRVDAYEPVALMHGMVEAIPDAFKLAWTSFRTDTPSSAMGKVEAAGHRTITAQNFGLDEAGLFGRFVDFVGTGARIPGRILMSQDEFNKAVGKRMELRAQASRLSRVALDEGKTPQEAAQVYADVMGGTNAAANAASANFADTITFTKKLGDAGQSVQNMAARVPGMRIILPFIRTPANIIKEFTARTPAAPILREVREDLLAGGARRDLALAKIATGSAAMTWAAHLAAQGKITGGGPADPNLRRTWLQKYQPYSMKIGDKWYPYGRIEPIGTLFGVAADYVDFRQWAPHDLDEATEDDMGVRAVSAILHNVGEKTFLTGVSEAAAAFEDPERHAESFVSRIASGFAQPVYSSALRDIENALDPTKRETKRDPYEDNLLAQQFQRTLNEVKARTPGFAGDLPPKRNFWGEELKAYEGSWVQAFNAFNPKSDKAQPIDEEILRLRYPVAMPSKDVEGIKLNPHQYDKVLRAMNDIRVPLPTGQNANMREYMNWLVGSAAYATLVTDERKAEAIKDVRNKFVDAAKAKLVTPGAAEFDGELFGWVMQARTMKPFGQKPRPEPMAR